MSTAAAVVTMNNAAAQAAAHRAKIDQCAVFESNFEAPHASVAEKQEYATCVGALYPTHEAFSQNETYMVKGGVLVLLIAMLIGAVWGWKDGGVVPCIAFGVFAPILTSAAIFTLYIASLGVLYLFS